MNINIPSFNNRFEFNKKIIKLLDDYITKNRDMRFIQALYALSIIEDGEDKFHEESSETYDKLIKLENN